MCAPNELQQQTNLKPAPPASVESEAVPAVSTVALPIATILPIAIYLLRTFMKGAQFKEKVTAHGKAAMVTNVTTAVGMETAKELNKRGAVVYMICPTLERGREVRHELQDLGCDSTRLILKTVNLDSVDEIRQFAENFRNEVDRLDILIENTDLIINPEMEVTNQPNQNERLGHFMLTELMLPLLKKSREGRIVIVSSQAEGRHRFAHVSSRSPHERSISYQLAKQANVMYASELTRRLHEEDPSCPIIVNCCHPGTLYSDVAGSVLRSHSLLRRFAAPLIWFCTKTITDGVQTSIYLALSKGVRHISGKYFE